MRARIVTAGLLLLLAPASLPGAADDGRLTLYLHSGSAVGAVDAIGAFQLGAPPPWMDEQPPTAETPRAIETVGLANQAFRRSPILAYWVGEAHGRLEEIRADLWIATPTPALVTVSLFGPGPTGVALPFATSTLAIDTGPPRLATFDFGSAAENVDGEITLSVGVDQLDGGAILFYDAHSFASRLSFRLADPVEEDPLTRTPAPGWGPVVPIHLEEANRETSLAMSPHDPNLLLACSPSGLGNRDPGHSFFHVSRNAGASWSPLAVETGAADPRRLTFEGGDCDVAIGPDGTLYAADTWLGSLSVGHSTNGGATWTGTALAAGVPIVDRPWIVAGPAGTLHVTWQDLQSRMPSALWYSRSTDHGLTFSTPSLVARANPDGAFTWTGNFVVSPEGRSLFSVYTRRAMPGTDLDTNGPEGVYVAASRDGGGTWTQHLAAMMPAPASFLYPSVALDEGGRLHVVFSSRTAADRPIWHTRSDDGAQTWSAPRKILAGGSGFAPWIVGGRPGEAVVQWYGTLGPDGGFGAEHDWYFFVARLQGDAVLHAGPTTVTPVYRGVQAEMPEYNQLRLAADGTIHLGASAFVDDAAGARWAMFHQATEGNTL